ncbi:MAG: hypothetical protein AABY84_03245 [Candidatus Firestonebacteria bacterium]
MNSTNNFFWSSRFEHNYKKLSTENKEKINKALLKMEENLYYSSLGVKKIKGVPNIWEARASQSLRITFTLEKNGVYLRTVGQHNILKNP